MTTGKALIVGAGICGLCCAWWLANQGWKVIVVERNKNPLNYNGYRLSLSGPGLEVAKHMGIYESLKSRNLNFSKYISIYRNKKKAKIIERRTDDDDGLILMRTDIVEVIYQSVISLIEIKVGEHIKSFSDNGDKVIIELSDSSKETVDLLIGADGIYSSTRNMLFGSDIKHIEPLGHHIAMFCIPDTFKLNQSLRIYKRNNHTIQLFPLPNNNLCAEYYWKETDKLTIEYDNNRELLKKIFIEMHPDVCDLVDSLPKHHALFSDALYFTNIPTWSKGRTILLGDSAHAVSPYSGQGASMALTSAWLLAKMLQQYNPLTALQQHEKVLRPIIIDLQKGASHIAKWSSLAPKYITPIFVQLLDYYHEKRIAKNTLSNILKKMT